MIVGSFVLRWQLADGFLDSIKPFHQHRPGTSNIDTLKALALWAKDETFIEVDSGLLRHQPLQRQFVQPQPPTVEPYKVCAFRFYDAYLRNMLSHICF